LKNLQSRLVVIDSFLSKNSKWFNWFVRAMWIITLGLVIGIPTFIYAVIWNPPNLFGGMPSLQQIENPQNDLSSELIAADGLSLGRYFREHRSEVTFEELPDHLVSTLLISEDHRFRAHSGLDLEAYLRVVKGIVTFNTQGGGSTLTQQTAKNLFRTREEELEGKLGKMSGLFSMLISKTKEWIIAVRLEETFTKEEIIALYFNTVPFNNNAFGIKVAAETYFKKEPHELELHECALLIGMLQGTVIYNPVRHPERALRKRNDVLRKLVDLNFISRTRGDSVMKLPLGLNFAVKTHSEGPAPYFLMAIRPELLKWCKDNGYNLYESGLKIYTTLDSRLQQHAEQALTTHMARLQKTFEKDWGARNPWVDESGEEMKDFVARKIKRTDAYRSLKKTFGDQDDSIAYYLSVKKPMTVFSWDGKKDTTFSSFDSLVYYNRFLQSSLMSMDPHTGAVKAWVGGIRYSYFQYDLVKQSRRQPGSTFKPFLYAAAIENGYSPCQMFEDISPSINVNGKIYQARNANGTYGDGKKYTLRQGLAKSLNSISVRLIDILKPENVSAFANKIGITSKLDPVYSLALGTSEVSLFELVGAYSTFVNHGIHTKPYYITRIEDKYGNVIQTFLPVAKQAIDETTAYTMVHMLKGGVEEEGGSSRALSEFVKSDNEIGGKTGTTDNGSDGWYVGVTNNLVTGVWVGGDERSIHFPRWGESSGGKTALPIFDLFMQKVYSDTRTGYRKTTFEVPVDYKVNLDCGEYLDNELDSLNSY
jgi:penicillin-binding protein 1A